jgi:intergrase/recombinase
VKKAIKVTNKKIKPQILRKWNVTTLGELIVLDRRFADVFQGRAPKSVLANHYTSKGLLTLNMIYESGHKNNAIIQ